MIRTRLSPVLMTVSVVTYSFLVISEFEAWELTPITANPILSDEMAGTDLRGRALASKCNAAGEIFPDCGYYEWTYSCWCCCWIMLFFKLKLLLKKLSKSFYYMHVM